MMSSVHRVSEIVYHGVNGIIGHHEKVMMRRNCLEIKDIIRNHKKINFQMISGSRGEGFDFEGSDVDIMYWSSYDQVICDLSQVYLQNIQTNMVILMEDQYTRPGFVLLRRLKPLCACGVSKHDYISSSSFLSGLISSELTNGTLHGPCIRGFIHNHEYDRGYCYSSKHWPLQAFPWIERCKRKFWPSPSVLHNIIQGGCHVMPIGAKNSPSEQVEWRMSYSQAEKKLVHSMSHTQFLLYGLLKLFLNEVINKDIPDDKKLLCSYFMKTAVFWEVQENVTIQWNMNNFLFHFWSCYKLLMKWVYNQYCPNFFVPQNNMFYPKITGKPQQQLFHQMLDLYNEGFLCLLRCSSIRDKLCSALIYPQHPIYNNSYFSECEHDRTIHTFCRTSSVLTFFTRSEMEEMLVFLLTTLRSNITQTQRIVVTKYIIQTCQCLAFILQNNQAHTLTNKQMYKRKKQGLKLMKVISKHGWLTDVLYLAIYLYNDGRYTQTLCLLQELQSELFKDYVFYETGCPYHYLQAVGGQSMSTKIKLHMADDMIIFIYTNFPELMLELRSTKHSRFYPCDNAVNASPFVLLHFLTFLCHFHLNNSAQQQQSLHDLHTLVSKDGKRYTSKFNKAFSWQMLGICYQLSEHLFQAQECYWEAQRNVRH